MIKIDIVKRVAEHLKIKDSEALVVVDAVIESIKEAICEDGRLEIRDFGVFQTKIRKPRVGRNPRNRREYPIPPRRVVTFKLGKELKDFALAKSGPSEPIEEGDDSSPSPDRRESDPSASASSVNQDDFLPAEGGEQS